MPGRSNELRAHWAGLLRWIDEFAQQGIFTTDTDLVIRSWNKWLETASGHDADSVVGRPLFQVFPELKHRGFEPYYRAALLGEVKVLAHGFHRYVIPPVAAGAKEVRQSGRIVPLVGDGTIAGTITVVEDVLERVVSERELRSRIEASDQARALAEEALRVKDEFLTTLSHEIRTPLNAVLGWTRMLLAKGVEDPQMLQRGLEIIDRNAMSQVRLIDDMLDTARIITGKLRLETRSVDLRRVALAAIDVVAPTANAKGVHLRADFDDTPVRMLGDPDRLQQIIWNLLANAVKFTDPGGLVTVGLRRGTDTVSLFVADTGEGIPAAFVPELFQRFRQADPSASRRHGGLGIGLSLVRQLVELHGGRIEVETREGVGSTFTVTFPSRPEGEGILTDEDEHGIDPLEIRVLVIAEDEEDRDLLTLVLRRHGAQVAAVSHATEAAAAAKALGTPYAIVASLSPHFDQEIPGLRNLRSVFSGDFVVPAVAILPRDTAEERERARNAGFDVHVTKPLSPHGLIEALKSAVGLN